MFVIALGLSLPAAAQTAALQGRVLDPRGAVVPGAAVSLTQGAQSRQTTSGAEGQYAFRSLAPGAYTLTAEAKGFSELTIPVSLAAGQKKTLDLSLALAAARQEVSVTGHSQGVSIEPDRNAGALVIKGSELDALSDDPNELESELLALAGPAAGPNGGQIYIDGFEGGQIPPKSSILEIHVNQNPFSAEYDRIGYGRVDIITKPGSQKLHGSIHMDGNTAALDTRDPLIAEQPSYYDYSYWGNVAGPISKTASYFVSANAESYQIQSAIDALDPATLSTKLSEFSPSPFKFWEADPRVDFTIAKNNFMSIRDQYTWYSGQGQGIGALVLPDQATRSLNQSNEVQIADTWIINSHLLMEPRFEWRRISNSTTSASFAPAVTVQGAFTTGGNGAGILRDHQDLVTLQDYGTATLGAHTLNFGGRARTYRDADYSTAGANGSYYFGSTAAYQANKPTLYSQTVIANPLARLLLFDGSLFVQDDWRVNSKFLLGLGLRYEGQNHIHDHADFGPRLSLAWAPGRSIGKQPRTVIRAGYGWFYERFTMSSQYPSGLVPYIITAIHDNLINQKTYTIQNPAFFNPNAAQPVPVLTADANSIPTFHSVDPHFHAALDMQGGIGVDHSFGKHITSNVTYLYTQGVHQYMSNNVTAPSFDISTYSVTGPPPAVYNYQFQSGGFYRQNQLIFTSGWQRKRLTLTGNYVLNEAKSDTQGINSFPSVAQDPGFDYGRASFGIRQRFFAIESYTLPHGIVVASLLGGQSGTPYNLTIGSDLTGNNQFNARPSYGACGATGVVATQYGCLNTEPSGTNERIIPFDLGTGPANVIYEIRASKVVGVGPRLRKETEGRSFTPGQSSVGGRGISGGGPAIRLDAGAPRRYNLTFAVIADNLFNMVNWGTPNGVLLSPLFGQTQTLAGGQFGSRLPGNRTIYLQTELSF